MADDPAVLLAGAGQEPGHVLEDDQGDVEGVAEPHEARSLVGGVDVQDARQRRRLVGHDARRVSAQVGEPGDQVAGEACVDFVEGAVVHHRADHVQHVVGLVGVLGHDLQERRVPSVVGVRAVAGGRAFGVVLGDVAKQLADGGQAFGLRVVGEVGDPRSLGVDVGASQPLHVHVLVGDRLHHARPGDEHEAGPPHHVHEVGDRRRVDCSPGARTQHHADLRDDSRRQRVAEENVGVAPQRHDALLDARASRVVEAHQRRPVLQRHLLHLDDLLGVGFAEGAAEDGEVLGEDVHQASADRAPAGDHAVAQNLLVGQAEFVAPMGDEAVQLDERLLVEEEVQPLPGRELAAPALRLEPGFAPAQDRLAPERLQTLQGSPAHRGSGLVGPGRGNPSRRARQRRTASKGHSVGRNSVGGDAAATLRSWTSRHFRSLGVSAGIRRARAPLSVNMRAAQRRPTKCALGWPQTPSSRIRIRVRLFPPGR